MPLPFALVAGIWEGLKLNCNVNLPFSQGVGASPKFFSNMFNGGRHRNSSIGGESLGCLTLLDAGEQRERPRAFPSTGEILPTYVKAQPTVHVHRPRAVLSSPENDELACELPGLQLTSSSSVPKAMISPSDDLPPVPNSSIKDLPHAPLSSIEDLAPILSSKDVLKAVPSPPNDLLSLGARETSLSDEASSNATSSNRKGIDDSNELADIEQNRSLTSAATKEKKFNFGLSSESRLEQNGNEENLSSTTAVNRMIKKHSSLPSNASRGPARQLLKPLSKGNSGRVLRPWY